MARSSNRTESSCIGGTRSTYPGASVTSTVAGVRGGRFGSSTRRRFETYACNEAVAALGGVSPHSSSMRRSIGTTSFRWTRSTASTARCSGAPRLIRVAPASATSNGPSTLKSTTAPIRPSTWTGRSSPLRLTAMLPQHSAARRSRRPNGETELYDDERRTAGANCHRRGGTELSEANTTHTSTTARGPGPSTPGRGIDRPAGPLRRTVRLVRPRRSGTPRRAGGLGVAGGRRRPER